MSRNAVQIWQAMQKAGRYVCLGLDPQTIDTLPEEALVRDARDNVNVEETLFQFTCSLVDAVADIVGAIKPNLAFWEKYNEDGTRALRRLVLYVHQKCPWLLVIADAKRNDIGNTAADYADAIFSGYGFDACTVNPMLGTDGIKPFTDYTDRMTILLVRTSNPSAAAQQDIEVRVPDGRTMLQYEWTAEQVANVWNVNNNCAAVVGATVPDQMSRVRQILGDGIPILSPGFGKQGADPRAIVPAALGDGGLNIIANSSRGLMYAFKEEKYQGLRFADATRQATLELHREINTWRRYGMAKRVLVSAGALKKGHFVLKAGDHAGDYVDKDMATMIPEETQKLAEMIAEMLDGVNLDNAVGPAYGGISLASYVAGALNKRRGLTGDDQIRALYVTKADDGSFSLRSNHAERVRGRVSVVVEDVVTTGSSASGVVGTIRETGGQVAVVTAIWNRGGIESVDDVPLMALIVEKLPTYPAADCPLCKEGIPVNTDVGHGAKYLAEQEAADESR